MGKDEKSSEDYIVDCITGCGECVKVCERGDWWAANRFILVEPSKENAADENTESQTDDFVNHPSHYTSHPSGVECITITRHMTFNIGNVFKYCWRSGLKDGNPSIQDLKKAAWYLEDEIKRLEGKND